MEDLNEAVKAMERGILTLTERDFIMKLQSYTPEMVRNMSAKQLEWLKRIADKNKLYG